MSGAEEILVGIDGSTHGRAATAWAMAEARSRNCGVLLVHVSQIASNLWVTTPAIRRGLRELTQPIVDHEWAFATRLDPEIPVRARLLLGNPHRALVSLSAGAALTVVGRRGNGAIATQLVGSVCRSLMAHAHGPVVAVAPDAPPAMRAVTRVVVAVGERPASVRHLEFGIEQARRHGVELVVLHACPPPREPGHRTGGEAEPAVQIAEATRRLSALIAGYAVITPGVTIRPVVLAGTALQVLRDFCDPADLLVLGRKRHGHQLAPTLGPVVSGALHELRCAVATAGDAVTAPERETPAAAPSEARWTEQPLGAAGLIAY